MEINGIKIEVLPIVELIKYSKKEVLKEYNDQIKQFSTDTKFIIDAAINAPKGQKLDELALEWMSGLDGLIKIIELSINRFNPNIASDKVQALICELIKDQEKFKSVAEHVMGSDIVEDKKK